MKFTEVLDRLNEFKIDKEGKIDFRENPKEFWYIIVEYKGNNRKYVSEDNKITAEVNSNTSVKKFNTEISAKNWVHQNKKIFDKFKEDWMLDKLNIKYEFVNKK